MSRKKFIITDIDYNELLSLIESAKKRREKEERERKERKERIEREERERIESKKFWDELETKIEKIGSNIKGGKLQKQKQLKLPKSKAKKATKATNKKVK